MYNEFNQGALCSFYTKKLSEDERQSYIKSYLEWALISQDKTMQAETDLLKSKMYEIESLVYHAEIIELRNIGQVRLQDQEGK